MIHRAAAVGFSRAADAYERARPEYPPDAVAGLTADLPSGARVLDLAAGTGKLTRRLLEAGFEVVAVEPVAKMRSALPEGIEAFEGRAEAIPLEDAAVDGATVAQAFHWFDDDRALREIHRVLRPGGPLGLIWNSRREDDPTNRAITELLEPHRQMVPTQRWDTWRETFERTTLFGDLEEAVFANEQVLDADGMEGRIGSVSYIAALDDEPRRRVLEAARALAGEGTVVVSYRCEVQVCRAL